MVVCFVNHVSCLDNVGGGHEQDLFCKVHPSRQLVQPSIVHCVQPGQVMEQLVQEGAFVSEYIDSGQGVQLVAPS